ncbi:MAG: hydrolase 1, exosortase A system-associated [Sphingomonadales bacterium]|nr:MAG: hydrolase 1, exosortase A system-associated [Sphingomonadales bacterium]
MRKLIAFHCANELLVGTLDEAASTTGLLIVSGGNEIRAGAHRGMATLAARVAEAGYPVFRFDRRGIGDSAGENRGFESTAADIILAATTFRREARLARVLAYGNCDAATALAFFHGPASIDALLLANPWTIESTDDLPPAAAIRSHYAERLRDPKEWLRLMRGGVNIANVIRGLRKFAQKQSQEPETLAARLGSALASVPPTTILLAKGDNTAIAFADAFKGPAFEAARGRVQVETLDSDSHSFASTSDKDWLFDRVIAALA